MSANPESPVTSQEAEAQAPPAETGSTSPWRSEDWWSIWLGGVVLLAALAATWFARPDDIQARVARHKELSRQIDQLSDRAPENAAQLVALRQEQSELESQLARNPLEGWLGKVGSWRANPLDALRDSTGQSLLPGLLGSLVVSLVLFGFGLAGMGQSLRGFLPAFLAVFVLAVFSYILAGQEVIHHYNLEYALWALVVGLIISNTIGTPAWILPAVRTEYYIKTGLVLLGAEVLFNRLLALGLPGVFISWVVTPIVLISTYLFGQYVLRIPSRSLNMVISADMSVCGVSAAIATAAACRAKKEELSLAIGLSLTFTVIMMVVMPAIVQALGLGEVIGGAWLGGTIDSTGAVAAAGGMLGETALAVAATIKMIQNILIGVVAFGVAVYWVTRVERSEGGERPSLFEIWRRFPKFVLGFVAASLVFSAIAVAGIEGEAVSSAVVGTSKTLRGWFFCLAFVSIGLETNFRELSRFLVGGRPLVLYLCGQGLNLALTLFMAWLMFAKVFPNVAQSLGG